MDPNAIIREIESMENDYDDLLEKIENLLIWLDKKGFIPEDGDCGDVIEGAYWFTMHHYDGMWSPEYRIHCMCSNFFSPGPISNGPESGSQAEYAYSCLEAALEESLS